MPQFGPQTQQREWLRTVNQAFDSLLGQIGQFPEGFGRTLVSERERRYGGIRRHPADVPGTGEHFEENILPMLGIGGILTKTEKQVKGALQVFQQLGFKPRSGSPEDLTSAYRTALKALHPDVAGPEAKGTVQVLNKAWGILKKNLVDFNPEKVTTQRSMGFSRSGATQKGFYEHKFPKDVPVNVKIPGLEVFDDVVKGRSELNAIKRAKVNWPGAKIRSKKGEFIDIWF